MTILHVIPSLLGLQLAVAQPSPEAFVQSHVTLDLAVNYEQRALAGSIILELENWTPRPAHDVSLLLGRLMTVVAVRDGTGRALHYTQAVERAQDEPMLQVNHVRVTLPHPVPAGSHTTLRIEYAGNLVGYTEVGWLYVKDRVDSAFTILRADALAFPVVGGLSRTANRRAPRRDFIYDASVRVPTPYVVATGGAVSRVAHDDGTVTWRYQSGAACPFLNIAIAPFDTLAGSGVRVFYFRSDSAGARRLMVRTQQALQLLTQAFGPLHAPLNLAITEIPDGWGSQAHPIAGIIQTASAFRDSTRVGELYHELTHLWNSPDTDAPSPRWNEGLAMFLQDLIYERIDGWNGRDSTSRLLIARMQRRVAEDSTLRRVPFVDYGIQNMTGQSYSVGNLMFATLYELVGETAFSRIVGGYYQTSRTGGTTRDFVTFAKRNTARDLTTFFDDWLFTTRWTAVVTTAATVKDIAAQY